MNESEKVLTYEEAKQMCMKAFDGGATYGSESMRYGVNARAYDWEHWLAKNERLLKPRPTVEDVLRDMLDSLDLDPTSHVDTGAVIAEYAQRLQLREVDDD